jgi:D-alanyl-D-alanine carboxypeptidase
MFSAYPGRSEHHTGLAIDITSESMDWALSQDFASYPEGQWLDEHCQDYGFILRYQKGKEDITGYQYEPWHFRYVGKEVAKEIMSRGITFEEYLGEN